jgi:hypothetical protein
LPLCEVRRGQLLIQPFMNALIFRIAKVSYVGGQEKKTEALKLFVGDWGLNHLAHHA